MYFRVTVTFARPDNSIVNTSVLPAFVPELKPFEASVLLDNIVVYGTNIEANDIFEAEFQLLDYIKQRKEREQLEEYAFSHGTVN